MTVDLTRHLAADQNPAVVLPWIQVKDGNPVARAIFGRHYTYNRRRDQISLFWQRNRNYTLIAGPGEKMVLLTMDSSALFVWRKFRSDDNQDGVSCAVFRNEGRGRASELIRAADVLALNRWPGERHYTYVNDRKVRKSRTPGRVFLKAGWRYMRKADGKPMRTKKNGLLILELPVDAIPEAVA